MAFVARRSGRAAMPAADWAHHLSLGLGWMAPGEARTFVTRATAAGVLRVDGEALRLAFPADSVDAPRGFRPAAAAPAEAPTAAADPFATWLDKVAQRTNAGRPAVLAAVAERQARMGGLLTAWAALLWLAAEAGLDVGEAAGIKA